MGEIGPLHCCGQRGVTSWCRAACPLAPLGGEGYDDVRVLPEESEPAIGPPSMLRGPPMSLHRWLASTLLGGLLVAGCTGRSGPHWPLPQNNPVVIALTPVLLATMPSDPEWRMVLDSASLQRVAELTPTDYRFLAQLVDRPIELGERCPQTDEARCITVSLWEAVRTDSSVVLVVQWARAARRCGGSYRARFNVVVAGGTGRIVEESQRTYGDCGPPPIGSDTVAIELAAARQLRSMYPRGRPAFQDLGIGTSTPLHRPSALLTAILEALNADLVDTRSGDPCRPEEGPDCTSVTLRLGRPQITGDSATLMASDVHWHSETLGGFAEYTMHFVRTAVGWEFARLGQGRQGTLLRRPD